jgi:Flp pilus assembly protein TadG
MRPFESARRLRGDRRGVTVLEFAIVALLLFTLILGAIDLARFWFTTQAVRWYTAELMRVVQVCDTSLTRTSLLGQTGNCAEATVRAAALQRVTGLNPANLTIPGYEVENRIANLSGARVVARVRVVYDFDFVVIIFGGPFQITDETRLEF